MSTEYHIALSFAGEDRTYVEQVANELVRSGVKVFYDKHEQVDLWGRDLYEHLSDIYKNRARYTIIFISKHYATKLWTRHERKAAQARAFTENSEYILPVRFDDTEVTGINQTTGYLDLRVISPLELAEAIEKKLVISGVALRPEPPRPSSAIIAPHNPASSVITVTNQFGDPVLGVDVMLVASNGTFLRQKTSELGEAEFKIRKRQSFDVFCAHTKYPAFHTNQFDPVDDLAVTIHEIEGVGSINSLGSWDSIPGLTGTLSLIHDSLNRMYLDTKNIAVDGGEKQPVTFVIGKPMHFEDSCGNERFLTVVAVIADCFLIEFATITTDM